MSLLSLNTEQYSNYARTLNPNSALRVHSFAGAQPTFIVNRILPRRHPVVPIQLDRACLTDERIINLPREYCTNQKSENTFVLEPGCGESISGVQEVIGAKLKKLEKRKVGKTSQIFLSRPEMDSPAQHSNTKVQSELS